ncbi:putative ankyrin repeat protein RF_0381 [Leptopilina boulardi]|uniref:putative ankyrin repeat protein RF_0381 n=1 Tax=Leptopilina boulardi TaxID=63433 RepID=UPI0021F5AEA9|nr:putative ankyrin repeat protein RF_0381 [Leptopilina boulardi]XP_051173334.1 putative ankyrin repeat protein RF_0381 [Leptopilina boulardi]
MSYVKDKSVSLMSRFRNAVKSKNSARINKILSEQYILENANRFFSTFLHFVAENGTVETANQLLKIGLSIHTRNEDGKTPIFYAFQNSLEMIKLLFDDKTIIDSNLLVHALYFGTEEIMRLLLKNELKSVFEFSNNSVQDEISIGTNTEHQEGKILKEWENTENLIKFLLQNKKYLMPKGKYYALLLFFAAKIDEENIFQLILNDCHKHLTYKRKKNKKEIHPEAVDIQNDKGETALHYAVSQQHIDAVKFLLKKGANKNCQSKIKYTPLHYAARIENKEICEILINSGASVNTNNDGRNNPLHLVSGYFIGKYFHGFDELTINVFRRFRGKTAFNKEIMMLLLNHGANPDMRGINGMPLFIQACKRKCIEEMKILLKFGANIQIADNDGNTALHHATINSSIKSSIPIIDFLLKNGLEIDVKNNDENTPLMFLVENMYQLNMKLIEYFVYHGSSLNAKNIGGNTIFDIALMHHRYGIALTLLELKGDRELNCDSDPEKIHALSKHCYGLYDHPTFTISRNRENSVLISYIALKRINVNDYFTCCLNSWYGRETWMFDNTKLELEKLKSRKILNEVGTYYSYYDFLVRDLTTAIRIIKNPTMKEELSNFNNFRDLPFCKQLFQHRVELANDLEDYLDKIVNFFLNYRKMNLPILVIDMILSYFSYRDLTFFGIILSEIKN